MRKFKEFDVVILGGGLAGIYTALNLDKSLSVGLFIKDKIEKGSSNLAQGGIALPESVLLDMPPLPR